MQLYVRKESCEEEVNRLNDSNKKHNIPRKAYMVKVAVLNPELFVGTVDVLFGLRDWEREIKHKMAKEEESTPTGLRKGHVGYLCIESNEDEDLEKSGLLRLREYET